VVQGNIKFRDGSVVNISGKDTVIFSRRRGDHKVLTGVYWIPRLRNSIISVRQMDEGGGWSCKWQGHSVSWCIRKMKPGSGMSATTTLTSARWRR
jgi:hypothetical protein